MGLGASHQTGWTGIIARLQHLFASSDANQVKEIGREAVIIGVKKQEKKVEKRKKELVH